MKFITFRGEGVLVNQKRLTPGPYDDRSQVKIVSFYVIILLIVSSCRACF